MYRLIKGIILKIFPRIIFRFEFTLRKIFAFLYKGNKVFCNICNKKFSKFIIHQDSDLICPRCGSLGRHRRLWSIINIIVPQKKDDRILHFSPSRVIQKKLKSLYLNYVSADFEGKIKTDRSYDITKIRVQDNSFDYVICYHVLEHIINDTKAIGELYRILNKGGKLLIQTPFKTGNTYEDFSIVTKEDRKKHFGQEDHVRIYSVQGLKERFKSASFKV